MHRKLEKFQNRQRHRAYLAARADLKAAQRTARRGLAQRQRPQRADLQRQLWALAQVETHEQRSLEGVSQRGERTEGRGGDSRMPALLEQASATGGRRARDAAAPARADFDNAGGSDKEKTPGESFDQARR